MWNRIKKLGYLITARYIFIGLILGVIIFQFVTISLNNQKLEFKSIIERETLVRIVATIIGGFVGVLVFISMLKFGTNREMRERNQLIKIKEKGIRWFVGVYIFAFSFGGFVGQITNSIFNYNNFLQSLFSKENTINYIGIILAAGVFGMFFAFGLMKRLKFLYDN